MKQMLEHFGGVFVAAIIASFLTFLFSGVQERMGEYAGGYLGIRVMELERNQAFGDYKNTLKWKLLLKSEYDLRTGVTYDTNHLFVALDPNGRQCEVICSSGHHEDNPDLQMVVEEDGKSVRCTHPGVYLVKIRTYSPKFGYHERPIRLLVNGEVIS